MALAIAERENAAATLARIQAATRFGMHAPLRDAERRVEDAQAAVKAAQEAAGAALAAGVASGEGVAPSPTLGAARQALADAHDALAAAREAERLLAEEEPAADRALRTAILRVKQAAAAVVREHPAVSGLVARVEKMQRELLAIGGVMEFLITANVLPIYDEYDIRLQTPEAQSLELARFRMSFLDPWSFHVGYREGVPHGVLPEDKGGGLKNIATAPWRGALAELEHSADAPLPEL